MAVKRKSLAPLNTSAKKALKVTPISANNTPAKLKKPVGPNKKNINAKQANLNKQTPSKGLNKKQKNKPFKPAASIDDDEEEEDANSDALEMQEDSDIEQEEGSVGDEESADGEDDSDVDQDAADDDEENDSDDDTKHTPPVKIANTVKGTTQKQTKDTKQSSIQEKVSKGDKFVLFVGHLNFKTTEEEIRAYFLKAGPVAGVNLARFRVKLASRGFAFIQMKDEAGFKKALKLNNTTLGGRQIRVEIANKSIDKTNDKPKPKSKPKKKATSV